jgi:hypothetical protein
MEGTVIGIGVTTRNRRESLIETLSYIRKFIPPGAKLVVVDDASKEPFQKADFRFEHNVGIAVAKNKCLELLDGCEHIFLFDDDCYPKAADWWKPYVENAEPHLMYVFKDFANTKARLNDNVLLYSDSKIRAWTHTRGCMLYLHRSCLDAVGGFDPVFGKWGEEHGNLSDRIYAAGLTTFPYMDVVGSEALIHSADEHREVITTVPSVERQRCLARNRKLAEDRKNCPRFVPYRSAASRDVIVTCLFVGAPDPQRNERWEPDKKIVKVWIDSAIEHGVEYVVLNDCFDDAPGFHRVEAVGNISPYWRRWVAYLQWLRENEWVDRVWFTDGSDVTMLRNPFPHMEPGVIYTGDEQGEVTRCRWMRNNHNESFMQKLYMSHGGATLRNAGLLGGSRADVMEFIRNMLSIWRHNRGEAEKGRDTQINGSDMGVFNYVAQIEMGNRTEHGPKVNTVFKKFTDNGEAWWMHK